MINQHIFVITDNIDELYPLCCGARSFSEKVTAIIFGNQNDAKSVVSCGADKIYYCDINNGFTAENYALAIYKILSNSKNSISFFNNSIRCRCVAGIVATHLGTSVLTSINKIEEFSGSLLFYRTVYGGTAQRSEKFTGNHAVVTVTSGTFDTTGEYTPTKNIEAVTGKINNAIRLMAKDGKKESKTNLVTAKRIIDVGRGFAEESDLSMCRKLAELLEAEIGCSRPVAENNKWLPKSHYMGITGVQVKPEFILVLGVSGQIQHIGGIDKSKIIIAINKDKNAPIFKNCDFGLVGDIYKIVPALINKLS